MLGGQLVDATEQVRKFGANMPSLPHQERAIAGNFLKAITRLFVGEVMRELLANLSKTHNIVRSYIGGRSATMQNGEPGKSKHDVKASMLCEEVLDRKSCVVGFHGFLLRYRMAPKAEAVPARRKSLACLVKIGPRMTYGLDKLRRCAEG